MRRRSSSDVAHLDQLGEKGNSTRCPTLSTGAARDSVDEALSSNTLGPKFQPRPIRKKTQNNNNNNNNNNNTHTHTARAARAHIFKEQQKSSTTQVVATTNAKRSAELHRVCKASPQQRRCTLSTHADLCVTSARNYAVSPRGPELRRLLRWKTGRICTHI